MLCEFCKSNNANVHLIKIVNGNAERVNLCIDCLKNFAIFPEEEFFNDLSKILTKVLEVDIKINDKTDTEKVFEGFVKGKNKKCSFCGINLNSIKSTGQLGCANCYKEFKDEITPIIKALHGSIKHVGKVPVISCEDIKIEKEIRDLEHRLREEIIVENFEEAARLRDTIKRLQKKLYVSRKIK